MERREFVERSALAAAAVALPALGRMRPVTAPEPLPEQQSFALAEMTVAQLQDGMRSGKLTSRGITQTYLRRIAALDRQGPTLRAVLETNPDALSIAEQLDAERKAGKVRGPLHGIPVIVKDNIDTHDKMQTTAGSLALEGNFAERDAFLVDRLRVAGAVILAKANLSEWANFRSSRASSGWSGRGRQCKNPYVLDRNPSGSSSGSAVAVSASYCAVAIGTETDGSIISPSNACGVVGIKPTVGLVSRAGVIPIAHSQDTAGPMCRTVADAAALLSALTGVDPRDPATAESAGHIAPDYTAFLDANGLRGTRIGVQRRTGPNPVVNQMVEDAIKTLRNHGAEVVDPADLETAGQLGTNERDVLQYEFKADLNAYLATMPANVKYRTLADLIAFNEANKDREMPYFGQETFIACQAKGPLTEQPYLDARAKCIELTRAKGIDATMDKHGLDAMMGPSGGPAGLVDLVTLGGGGGGGGSSQFPAVSGYPHITVPAGFHMGLPMGISFYGRAWSEGVLIKVAYAFEGATKARKAPTFVPTLDLS
ncbi:MAG: amidase [Gemmatimonadetes bacterium RIFCSPLOWO2_12_FULL_68_9]|nr:MAG: amidase [Gemmatimonadetes bacterium RIFCSPLOWO2_12_FULL_68_9]